MTRYLIILTLLILTSCASIEKNKYSKNNISENSISIINGTYKNIPTSGGGFYVRNLVDIFDRNRNMFKYDNKKYGNENLKFKLNLISTKEINVKIFDENKLLFDKSLRIDIKDDGFIYLKEKRFMLDGFPFLLGGWNIQKSRFAIDKTNNLYVQSNYFFLNGILVIFCDWKTLKYEMSFEKE